MALTHVRSGQSVSVAPFGAALAAQKSSALFKSDDLELMRLVLPAGSQLPLHQVAGEVTVQCLEGRLEVSLPQGAVELTAGELVLVGRNERYAVKALEAGSALLSIVLRPKS
jgi:quercetin dioxygenase-like cupin family protein